MVNANIPIRLTGFGRVGYERDEIRELIRILYAENSRCLMFGSDLPSTRAKYRFSSNDIDLIKETVSREDRIESSSKTEKIGTSINSLNKMVTALEERVVLYKHPFLMLLL